MKKSPIDKLDQSRYVKSALRMPSELRNELKAAAEHNGRSMNAEIIARLQERQMDAVLSELARLRAMMQLLIDRD
ncbi:MAG: Arc family DNA-binding protein [Pseudomonadota bacterium]